MTPEGRVKRAISRLLDQYGAYKFMPVPTGYGPKSLDYLVCYKGTFIGIEAKKPGGKATRLQYDCMRKIKAAGGNTIVIDSVDMGRLKEFMEEINATSSN